MFKLVEVAARVAGFEPTNGVFAKALTGLANKRANAANVTEESLSIMVAKVFLWCEWRKKKEKKMRKRMKQTGDVR